jgi:hypothetical protein
MKRMGSKKWTCIIQDGTFSIYDFATGFLKIRAVVLWLLIQEGKNGPEK